MKLVCISDTHGLHDELTIPEGDVLIHAGDFSRSGKTKELIEFNAFLLAQPHRHKIVIAGNHDWCFERDRNASEALLSAAVYLQDSSVDIEGVQFYGSPWQPRFFDWAFNLDRGEPLKQVWSRIPQNTDVLITHGPPLGIGDEVKDGYEVGCEDLLNAIERVQPKVHIFGHIHEGYGTYTRAYAQKSTTFINACNLDERYQVVNAPIVIEVEV